MEYVIVSLFGTFFTVVAIGFLTKVFKEKLQKIADKVGIEASFDDFNPFEDR